jgi:TolB-like protein
MKKSSFLVILLFCSFWGYAQEKTMILDDAIRDTVDFFSSKLPSGTTVAITNFEAETKGLSDFIIEELLVGFANAGNIKVVERSRLELLETELDFNMSGSVSDETAQSIGHMIGAQVLFSGSIDQYRDMYRMRIRAILIETSEIIGVRTVNIKYESTLSGLLGRINPADAWKYQWFYAGFSLGYSRQILRRGREDWEYYMAGIPFGYSIYAQIQPVDYFGIALDIGGELLEGPIISVVPTITIRPASFEMDLFFGAGAAVIQGDIAFFGGIRGGYKAGPGILYAEARPIGCLYSDGDGIVLNLNITLGYQLGLFPRKK